MAQDVTGFASQINLIASSTFPAGIMISQFSDDTDPLNINSANIGNTAMGVNGDLIGWQQPVIFTVDISVIAGSQDMINLDILSDANRVGKGKNSSKDIIQMTVVYPDGTLKTFANGRIVTFAPAKSITSGSGRLKTKQYIFNFESII